MSPNFPSPIQSQLAAGEAPPPADGRMSAQLALCVALLPVWGRHLATSRTQSEAAVNEMMSAFAEIGPHLDRAARQSHQITQALSHDAAGSIINLAQACSRELEPLLAQSPPAVAATLRTVLAMVHKSVDGLAQLSQPFEHETQMVSQQVERMYVGFQYQDRISQMMTLLHDDMARLAAVLADPARGAQALSQEAWLERLASQYVMQDQREDHAAKTAGTGAASLDTTFF
jgi:hypothetical protein